MNPQENINSRTHFLFNFKWTDSNLKTDAEQAVEALPVEFHDTFAPHHSDIGLHAELKVQLTPLNDIPADDRSLSVPSQQNDDVLVELATLHKYGIIKTLPFSKHPSSIFAQRKPNGKLRLVDNLRKINTLIADDHITNNHPVNTLTGATEHMARKKLFCTLQCSQAYHCLQMADQQSIGLAAFNFASRTFAYQKLAPAVSRSLSVFSSFIREFLNLVMKTDQCAQYVDSFDIAANTPHQLINNLRAVFQCLTKAGLQHRMAICHLGSQEVDLPRRTIPTKGVGPQKQKITKFLEEVNSQGSKEALQRYFGFSNYYRNYKPRLAERLSRLFQLFKTTEAKSKTPTSQDKLKEVRDINEASDR